LRLTSDAGDDVSPVWRPDGLQVVFASNRDKNESAIFAKLASGASPEELLLPAEEGMNYRPLDESIDGKWLVFAKTKTGLRDLWALPLTGDKKPIPYTTTSFDERDAALSPNGRWLAYASN